MKNNTLMLSEHVFGIFKVSDVHHLPKSIFDEKIFSVTSEGAYLSVVCRESVINNCIRSDLGWCCYTVIGQFDFDEPGIISSIVSPLADAEIGTFVISTFDSDYIFTKNKDLPHVKDVLTNYGHKLIQSSD